jgi:hypothetical protein
VEFFSGGQWGTVMVGRVALHILAGGKNVVAKSYIFSHFF